MSTVSDEMVEAAWAIIRSCGAPVGAGDGNTYIPHPPSKADVLRALEAAEAVRVKAESNLQKVQIPTSTIPEGFIPWHGGECPVAEGTKVETMLRNGEPWVLENAENFFWLHEDADDIIGYRVHKPADFRLEAGKFYVTASGERVGPVEENDEYCDVPFSVNTRGREADFDRSGICLAWALPYPERNNILALSSNQGGS